MLPKGNWHKMLQVQAQDILDCIDFSRRTLFCILSLWPRTMLWSPGLAFMAVSVFWTIMIFSISFTWFLDELANLLCDNWFISVHFTTIYNELWHAGYSIKKLRKIAEEWSPGPVKVSHKSCPLKYLTWLDLPLRLASWDPWDLWWLASPSPSKGPGPRFGGNASTYTSWLVSFAVCHSENVNVKLVLSCNRGSKCVLDHQCMSYMSLNDSGRSHLSQNVLKTLRRHALWMYFTHCVITFQSNV